MKCGVQLWGTGRGCRQGVLVQAGAAALPTFYLGRSSPVPVVSAAPWGCQGLVAQGGGDQSCCRTAASGGTHMHLPLSLRPSSGPCLEEGA